jgi:ferredoxin
MKRKIISIDEALCNGCGLCVDACHEGAIQRVDVKAPLVSDSYCDFMRNRITLIGCPKLDEGDYAGKLAEILRNNEIKSVTVLRMEVPCCGGIASAVQRALQASGKTIPWRIFTVSTEGTILDDD